jgi:hypothetical protein
MLDEFEENEKKRIKKVLA